MRHYYAHGWNSEVGLWALYAFETGKERDAFCVVTGNAPIMFADARREYMRAYDNPLEPFRYIERDPYSNAVTCDYGYVMASFRA